MTVFFFLEWTANSFLASGGASQVCPCPLEGRVTDKKGDQVQVCIRSLMVIRKKMILGRGMEKVSWGEGGEGRKVGYQSELH